MSGPHRNVSREEPSDCDPVSAESTSQMEGPGAPSLGESAGSGVRGSGKGTAPLGPPRSGPELTGRVWAWAWLWAQREGAQRPWARVRSPARRPALRPLPPQYIYIIYNIGPPSLLSRCGPILILGDNSVASSLSANGGGGADHSPRPPVPGSAENTARGRQGGAGGAAAGPRRTRPAPNPGRVHEEVGGCGRHPGGAGSYLRHQESPGGSGLFSPSTA